MLRAVVAIGISLVACVAANAADNAATPHWTARTSPEKCELIGALLNVDGQSTGQLEIGWRSPGYYSLAISIKEPAPLAIWRFEEADLNESLAYQVGPWRYISVGGDAGERAKRRVAEGRSLTLMPRAGVDRHRLTTGTRGTAESLKAFDQCVATIKATPIPPPPSRWAASTQGGRDCMLQLSDVSGVRGLDVRFGARPKSPLTFAVSAESHLLKDAGVLRIVLPGDPNPFTTDIGVLTVSRDPRAPALYAAIKTLKPVDMVYAPRGAKPIALRTSTDGLTLASAMFDACAAALKTESLPPQLQFNELRYVVTEEEDLCELTGTFQLDGNAIWVTLMSDGQKNVVKIARRTVGAGYQIQVLGLGRLGGPDKLTAADATFELDAKTFAALRRDLIANGRDFQIVMSRDRSYTAQFGGALAVVEAPMFEACAHAKFDTR